MFHVNIADFDIRTSGFTTINVTFWYCSVCISYFINLNNVYCISDSLLLPYDIAWALPYIWPAVLLICSYLPSVFCAMTVFVWWQFSSVFLSVAVYFWYVCLLIFLSVWISLFVTSHLSSSHVFAFTFLFFIFFLYFIFVFQVFFC